MRKPCSFLKDVMKGVVYIFNFFQLFMTFLTCVTI